MANNKPLHGYMPQGSYMRGSRYGSDLNFASIQAILKGAPIGAFVRAQNVHRASVAVPIDDVTVAASDAQNAASAAQTEIARMQAGPGYTTYTFVGLDNQPLDPAKFTTLLGNTPSNKLCIVQGRLGLTTETVNHNDEPWALIDDPFPTDDQTISAVIGSVPTPLDVSTSIYLRGNAAGTLAAYLTIFKQKVYVGYTTRSGASWVPHDWAGPVNISLSNGDRFEFSCDTGYNYTVTQNGQQLLTTTDSGHAITPGASQRTPMVRMHTRYEGVFGNVRYDSARLFSITVF